MEWGFREITQTELEVLAREPYPDTGLMYVVTEMYRRLNGLERGVSLTESAGEMLVLSHVWNTETATATTDTPHTHDWTTGITGKPTSFTPASHTHDAYSLTTHTHAAGGAHRHVWGDLDSIPLTFPPDTHPHDYAATGHGHVEYAALNHHHNGVYAVYHDPYFAAYYELNALANELHNHKHTEHDGFTTSTPV